ncbi:MAG: molybdenum ABC transporter ATP-binding protein [Rhizobiaceae bacterium]
MSTLSVNIEGMAGSGFPVHAEFSAGNGITGLFGHSGAGKTTVLKMIAGTLQPQSGRIEMNGQVLFDSKTGTNVRPFKRRTGFVFQDGRLFPHLTVRRNLSYAGWAGSRKTSRSFHEIVDLLGLGEHLDRWPETLSGGERQRVAIGRALLSDPAILLMDEPLSSLDYQRRADILPYLESIRQETDVPIVYVSHEIDEIARLTDTLVVMSKGTVVASGDTNDMFARLDLGPALGRQKAGVLLSGTVRKIDEQFGLISVDIGGQLVEVVGTGYQPGQSVRLQVRARDVSIATSSPDELSIRNCLACVIEEIRTDDSAFAELSLRLGDQSLRARITRKSVEELKLRAEIEVFALLKAVSVERRAMTMQT